jgi:hypothetical protein
MSTRTIIIASHDADPQVHIPHLVRNSRVCAVACYMPRLTWSDADSVGQPVADQLAAIVAEEFFGAIPVLEHLSLHVAGHEGDAPTIDRFVRVNERSPFRRLPVDEDHSWADTMVSPPLFSGIHANVPDISGRNGPSRTFLRGIGLSCTWPTKRKQRDNA